VLACDLVIAADSAYFALPEVRRGQIAGGGGVVRLPRLIPRHVAAEIVLTGRPISAARAEKLGLVNQVVQRNAVLPTAVTLAEEIAANAPLAVAASKHLLYSSLDWPPSQALHNQEPHVRSVRDSADAAEGARAFAEKRQPIWEGA
jgi:enoyl-CoA hydratase/carnithine racemase